MVSHRVSVAWDDFNSAAISTVRNLYTDQDFTDVTLTCEGEKLIKAHKVILSASSSFFRRVLLDHTSEENLLLCLLDVSVDQLESLVEFIYLGEVRIPEEKLTDFLELGKTMEICGIIGHDGPVDTEQINTEKIDAEDPLNKCAVVPVDKDFKTEEVLLSPVKEEVVDPSYEFPQVIKKDKAYKCNICDFSSAHYASVRKHKISKHDRIKYQCDKCVKSFSDSSTLLRHKKSIHDGFVYRCDLCLKTFSDGSALTRHKKKIHAAELPPLYDPFYEF